MREQSNSNTSTTLIVAQTQDLFFNLKVSANLFCMSNPRVPALSSEVPFQLGRSCNNGSLLYNNEKFQQTTIKQLLNTSEVANL